MRAAKSLLANAAELAAWLTQNGVRCHKHRLIVVIRQSCQEMANPTERLAQKQVGSELIRGRRISISLRKLKLGIVTAEDAGRSKKIHHRVRNPLLWKLHIQNRLAVSDQCAIYGHIETPDQAAKLIGEPPQLGAVHRNFGNPHGRA